MNRIKTFVLATVAAGLGFAAPMSFAGTNTSLPYFCNFEGYTNSTPLVDGTQGWYASSSDVVVQTDTNSTFTNSTFNSGTNAAKLPYYTILSNRFSGITATNLWIQIDMKPVLYKGDDPPSVITNATALFYINSNGYFVVHNGSPTNWSDPITNTVAGPAVSAVSTDECDWVRIHLYQNYTNMNWTLFADYKLLKEDIGFVSNAPSFNGFDLFNGATTSFLDNVKVTSTNPPDLGNDGGDWLPDLNVNQTNLTRSILEGQNATNQSFEVWKTKGYYSLAFSNTVSANWLSVSQTNGQSAGEHQTITVSYNTTGLVASVTPYTATITVEGSDARFGFPTTNSPITINVSVSVQGALTLMVSSEGLTNEVSKGHKAPGQTFQVWNGGNVPRAPLYYTVTDNQSWITVNPTNGLCVDNTNTVSITYNTANLSNAWYTGVVTVASDTSSKTVEVVMRVNATPKISVTPNGLTNDISMGEGVSNQTIYVYNGSDEPHGTLRYDLTDNLDWLTLSSAGGTSTSEQDTVTLTYNIAELPAGVYTGEVTITGMDNITGDTADNSPLNVVVKLTINGNSVLETSANGFTNTILENFSTTNTFTLWNGSATPRVPMTYTVQGYASWMNITPASGTVTDDTNTIVVVVDSGTLSVGTYQGTITVDATDQNQAGSQAANAPQEIPIKLVVTSRTPLNFELPEIVGIPYLGQSLDVNRGLWQYENRLSFDYQWQRANAVTGDGVTNIVGATGTNLVVTEEDRGKFLRVKIRAEDSYPTPLTTIVYSDFADSMKIRAVASDYSGNGLADIWFFDALPGIWRIAYSGGGEAELQFGSWETEAVPGDYDGNGVLDFAVYYQDQGMWYVLFMPSGQLSSLQFGWGDTEPVEGDYDGDGTTDIAVYWPAGAYWFIFNSSTWEIDMIQFGWSETTPVPGDYDGDGATDLGAYYAGTWYIWTAAGGYWTDTFGDSNATPAPADYDGDAITDLAVYWSAENIWNMLLSESGEIQEMSFGTSNGAGIPAPAYYDHDRMCDPATVHISGNFIIWCVQRSSEGYRGQSYQSDTEKWRVVW